MVNIQIMTMMMTGEWKSQRNRRERWKMEATLAVAAHRPAVLLLLGRSAAAAAVAAAVLVVVVAT